MTTQDTDQRMYHPLAGCAGTQDPAAADYDGRWLLVDEDWNGLDFETHPRLAEIGVELRYGYLVIRAPGMLRMDLPLDVIEDDDSVRRTAFLQGQGFDVVDEGDLAAAWVSNFLGSPARLVKVHPDAEPPRMPESASRPQP